MRKTPIKLRLSVLSGRVYALTRYTEKDGLITAHDKSNVTEDFEEVCADYLSYLAEQADNPVEPGEGHKYLRDGLDELVRRLNAKRTGAAA